MDAKESYYKVFDLVEKHHKWFKSSIPLIASENIPSPAVREAIVSDFGNRYAEGWPGERVYAGCIYIDQVELICNELAKRVFKSEFADCRATSGVVANLAIYSAFSNPGDHMIAASIPSGGHISHGKKEHSGTAGLVHGLNIEHYPFSKEDMTIDVDATKKKVAEMIANGRKPAIAMFGGSLFLFPHPVRELAPFMHDNNIYVNYDGAHVAGLIAGGEFQDPIGEGSDSMTMSSIRPMGSQGGIIVSLEKYAETSKRPSFQVIQVVITSTCSRQSNSFSRVIRVWKGICKTSHKKCKNSCRITCKFWFYSFRRKTWLHRITPIGCRRFQIWRWWNN